MPTLASRYRLLEPLGSGRVGAVWRALDLDTGELVAVKQLHPAVGAEPRLRAAARAALVRVADGLDHPGVARLHGTGRVGDVAFVASEYIPGESLVALLARDERLPHERVAALARGLCQPLAAAHAVGLVHGGLEPGDVILHPTRGVVLTDLGLVHALVEAGHAGDTASVRRPPEQLLTGEASPAGDVYAVGVLLFELLAGALPPQALDVWLAGEPDLHTLAPDLPAAWIDLLSDCLRHDPEARPPDACALLGRLLWQQNTTSLQHHAA